MNSIKSINQSIKVISYVRFYITKRSDYLDVQQSIGSKLGPKTDRYMCVHPTVLDSERHTRSVVVTRWRSVAVCVCVCGDWFTSDPPPYWPYWMQTICCEDDQTNGGEMIKVGKRMNRFVGIKIWSRLLRVNHALFYTFASIVHVSIVIFKPWTLG